MESKTRNRGITLIALIITVVVMLILAGVAIAQFTGGDGIFSRVTDATREYKKQSMLEAVDLAKAYLEVEQTYKNEPITITDVIDKVKEISSINDEDYIITIDDEEQTATIIDKQTGVVIDIWIDEDGKIQTEGSIVDDIENIVKPTVTYVLDPPAGTYGDQVKITITATEEKNGIVRMVLPDNSEITYNNEKTVTREYVVTENGTYKFIVEGANGRETTKYVEVRNIKNAAEIVMEVQNSLPTNQNVSIKITYDENVRVGGQALVNTDRFQYKIENGEWQIAANAETTIQVGVNGTIYARYYDGSEGFGTVTAEVHNIDKIAPNTFNLSTTKTTNSITVSGSTIDTATAGCAENNYGIAGYQFQLKNSTGSVITSWTTLQEETSYTFNNLTQGETYQVSMRAVDKAGTITEATNKDLSVTLDSIADSSTAIGISYSPTTPTKGNVQVTFTNNSDQSGLTLKYQKDSTSGSWTTYTGPVTMETNGTVYARLFDENEQYTNTATATVKNIDKIAPTAFNLSTTKTTNSITVSGSSTDTATEGCAAENYGIAGYQFQLKNNEGTVITSWTTAQASGSYTFSNLTQGTTYKVSMRAVDKAGNMTEATNKDTSVTLGTVADSSTAIAISYNPSTATKGNVQVTFTNNSGQSGLTLKYQIESTTGTWTEYKEPVTMETNGKVYARLFDKNEQYTNTATATVDNIDKVLPVISSATASTSWGKTNSVTITATDTGTTDCATENIGIVGYGINQSNTTEPSYTTVAATTSLNTTVNVSANGTYYVWVKDQAGNAANKQVIVNRIDTTPPTTATIASSNVEETTFTLTAKGADGQSGIAKYEFYLNGKLEKTITTTSGTATYNVTGKTGGQSYKYKVRVYDKVGLYKESSEITVTTQKAVLPIAEAVSVGDFVNYDAGTWIEADFNKITSSPGSPTVNKSSSKPTSQGQFGGFTNGQSRNSNSTPYNTSYTPDYSGWRVWDIDENTGEITLISAGHSETYYHGGGGNAQASINILKNRDCSMYENQYAKSGSAHILTGQEVVEWYNKQFNTNYTLIDNNYSDSTFYWETFTTAEPISVLENGSYFWLASLFDTNHLYGIGPDSRRVSNYYNGARGVRVLVSLESDVQVKEGTATGGVTTWDIVGN